MVPVSRSGWTRQWVRVANNGGGRTARGRMRTQFGHPPPPLFVCLIVHRECVTRTACAKMGGGVNRKREEGFLQRSQAAHTFADARCLPRRTVTPAMRSHSWSFMILDEELSGN